MRDDNASVMKFAAKWGPLDNSEVTSGDYWRRGFLDPGDDEMMERLLRKNPIPDTPALFIEPKQAVINCRGDWLRSAWRGNEDEWLRSPMAVKMASGSVSNRMRTEI